MYVSLRSVTRRIQSGHLPLSRTPAPTSANHNRGHLLFWLGSGFRVIRSVFRVTLMVFRVWLGAGVVFEVTVRLLKTELVGGLLRVGEG